MSKRRLRLNKKASEFKALWTVCFISVITIGLLSIIWKVEELNLANQLMATTDHLYNLQAQRLADSLSTNQRLTERLARTPGDAPISVVKAITQYYVARYFGKASPIAEKTFTCESGLNPLALNRNTNGSVDRGVAQINSVHAAQFEQVTGVPYEIGAHDISLNVQFAKWLYDHSGMSPWVCYQLHGGTA